MGQLEAVTDRIRQASDIADVVGRFVALKHAGRVLKGLCPFHAEKTPSFTVNPERQIFKCFGCGAGGDVFKFIQLHEHMSFLEARRWLADRAGIALESDDASGPAGPSTRARLAAANEWAAGVYSKCLNEPAQGAATRAYLERRSIRPETWASFRLGLAPDRYDTLVAARKPSDMTLQDLQAAALVRLSSAGRPYDAFRNRLMFPIADAGGRVVGFGGRTLGDDPAKYVNTAETVLFSKSRLLYGLPQARAAFAASRRAVVVEGYTDCLMAHQFGIHDTVATLGTAFTNEHGQVLRRYVDSVVLVFDGDEAGQAAADRALEVGLAGRLEVRIVVLPKGQDPCDLLRTEGAEAFRGRLNSAVEALEFKWCHIQDTCRDTRNPAARREVIDRFIEFATSLTASRGLDEIDRGELLGRIGRLVGVSSQEVHRYAARIWGRSRRPAGPESSVAQDRTSLGPASLLVNRGQADAEESVLQGMLEVMLCEPALLDQVDEHWSPTMFRDGQLRRIAEALVQCVTHAGGPQLTDVLARLEEPAAASLAVELERLGRMRGNYPARMEDLVEMLGRIRHRRQTREAVRMAGLMPAGDPRKDEVLRTVSEGALRQQGFASLASLTSAGEAGEARL